MIKRYSKIKLVIFDADETIIPFKLVDEGALQNCLLRYGNNVLFEKVYMRLEKIGWYLKDRNIISTSRKFFELRIYLMGLFLHPTNIVEFHEEYKKGYLNSVFVMNKAKEVIAYCKTKGYTVVIASTNYFNEDAIKRTLVDVEGYYTKKLMEDKKSVYDRILEDLNFAPNEILVIGDNIHDDVITPQKLGFKSFWLNESGKDKHFIHHFVNPNETIYSLEEVRGYL